MRFSRKRFITSVLAVPMCVMLAGCGSSDSEAASSNIESEAEEMNKLFNVKKIGRTYETEDQLWLGLSGSGAEFEFTGDTLKITAVGNMSGENNRPRLAVYVDGERKVDEMLSDTPTDLEIKGKGDAPVNVQIIKLSEAAQSCCSITGIDAGGGSIKPAADKAHKIEFIGDSITCGYGVDDEDQNHHFETSTEDCTKAYAYKTAQLLDADYSLVSYSGYGIISGYTDSGKKVPAQQVPKYYEKLAFTHSKGFGKIKPDTLDWDFSLFQPEAVVINLGTNDASYTGSDTERKEDYVTSYVKFLKTIREKNPGARIYCTLGIMDSRLNSSVEEAAKAYTDETGDDNIRTFLFKMQDAQNDGLAADWHPTEKTHQKSAEALADFIKTDLGW